MDQYITLVSNASMDIYPDNRLSSFRTRLPYLHDFSDGPWTVGLTEITYTKSWFNVPSGHHVSPAFIDDSKIVTGMERAKESAITPGYYSSPSELVTEINRVMAKWPKSDSVSRLPELSLRSNGMLFLKKTGKLQIANVLARDFGGRFDRKLQKLLGIEDKRPPYLDQGMTSLFIYTDILKPQVVGDSFEPLLRTIGVDSTVPFGQNVTEIFEEPYYLPLSTDIFQEITVNIMNDMGERFLFNFGRVTVTLHFKR